MIFLFLSLDMYLFPSRVIFRATIATMFFLWQAELRRLMGSDEKVLVLDVYCALGPKELKAWNLWKIETLGASWIAKIQWKEVLSKFC